MLKKYSIAAMIVWTIGACANDQRTIKKEFYSSGAIKSEYNIFMDTIKDGLCKEFYENGNLSAEAYYKNNIVNGEYKIFYENGKTKEQGTVINGKHTGEIRGFDSNGTIRAIDYYSKGILDSGKVFGSAGNFIESIRPVEFISTSDTIKAESKFHGTVSLRGINKFSDGHINVHFINCASSENIDRDIVEVSDSNAKFQNGYIIDKKIDTPGKYLIKGAIIFKESNGIDNSSVFKHLIVVLPSENNR